MIELLVGGIIAAVLSEGLDATVEVITNSPDDAPTVDLQPVLDSLERLTAQGSELLDVLQRPSETAGHEFHKMAVLALSQGWYKEALADALKSIDLYRFRATTHLVGAMAAVKLGDGEQAMKMLSDCVKYSSYDEPEVGAVAALAAAGLASAIHGRNYSVRLLRIADENTDHRCPSIVAALANLTGDDAYASYLLNLWWSESSMDARMAIESGWRVEIPYLPAIHEGPYQSGGMAFIKEAESIRTAIRNLGEARRDLQSQVRLLELATTSDVPALGDLDGLLRSCFGIKTPLFVTSLRRTLAAVGLFDQPDLPSGGMLAFKSYDNLIDVRTSFRFIRKSALFLKDLIDILVERDKLGSFESEGLLVRSDSISLLRIGAVPGLRRRSTQDTDVCKLREFRDLYFHVLDSIVIYTAENNLKNVSRAKRNYLSAIQNIRETESVVLPVIPWMPTTALSP